MGRPGFASPADNRLATLAALGAILVYAVVLAILKWVPLYDCVVLVPLLTLTFRALDRAPLPTRARVLYAVSAILASALLVRLWTLGYEGRNAVFGGILPWSDSGDFLSDALRLVHGERFTPGSSRRPLFVALLASLLKLGGGDLRFALAVLAVVDAFSIALPAIEVWRTHGWKSALIVYLILIFFLRRWTGFVQTEHFGLPMGAVGFALLWRAHASRENAPEAYRSAIGAAIFGVFALSLGLFARAGCFFVLPAFAVSGMLLAAPGRRSLLFAGFALAGSCALCIHEGILVAAGSGTSFSDYPPIFYGMLHGEDFTFLSQTHPALTVVPDSARGAAQWAIIWRELSTTPAILPVGLARSFLSFFTSPFGLFSCVWTNPDERIFEDWPLVVRLWTSGGPAAILGYWRHTLGAASIANAIAMGALGAGFVVGFGIGVMQLLRPTADPTRLLLRAAALGILASVPFMPPWITSGAQVQTGTLAFVAAVPAVLFGKKQPNQAADAVPCSRSLALGVVSCLGALFVMVAWMRTSPRRPPPEADATGGDRSHWVDIDASSAVEVAARRSLSFRKKGLEDLGDNIQFLAKHNQDLTKSVVPSLEVGTVFHSAYDPVEGHWEILVDEERRLEGRGGWVQMRSSPRETVRVQTVITP